MLIFQFFRLFFIACFSPAQGSLQMTCYICPSCDFFNLEHFLSTPFEQLNQLPYIMFLRFTYQMYPHEVPTWNNRNLCHAKRHTIPIHPLPILVTQAKWCCLVSLQQLIFSPFTIAKQSARRSITCSQSLPIDDSCPNQLLCNDCRITVQLTTLSMFISSHSICLLYMWIYLIIAFFFY